MASSSTRNPVIRTDIIFNKSVIFSTARARRPSDFKSASANSNHGSSSSSSCPFCIGREHECAPEIFRVPRDTSDWKIRVIENLYPALRRDIEFQSLVLDSIPEASVLSGFGFHDVVIETPTHDVRLSDLSAEEVGGVLIAFKERVLQLRSNEVIKYVQIFKNYGASAGASMSHSHSQIMGLPVVPPSVSARLNNTKEYFENTGKCGVCDIKPGELLIDESSHFFSVVPFAACFPFEIWIIPRQHSSYFHELDCEKAVDLGGLLKLMLRKLSQLFNDPPFNFMVHTSPFQATPSHLPYCHWFLQIVPQLSGIGGFEMGSGCYINPVFPEEATKILREVEVSNSN
ncbi:ADP-glucose phosphorylase [Aristolochia californica]|uniref:ADP-glucose phosphorylase n=1 Tax=Aristolochia californica TaxID=171875 RepID=UPI0035E1D1E9